MPGLVRSNSGNNTPRKAGSIRSLSAPMLQVRKNRTSHLRDVFSVYNSDLANMTKPPMAETNPTVAGQNKSAAMMSQKQIGLWFRDRTYVIDKLQRSEDAVYERLCLIEKTKWNIQKIRENRASTAYSRSTFNSDGFPQINQNSNNLINSGPNNNNGNEKLDATTVAEKLNEFSVNDAKATGEEKKDACVVKEVINIDSIQNKNPGTISAPENIETLQQEHVRPVTQQNNAPSPRPILDERAATNVEGMLNSNIKSRPLTPKHTKKVHISLQDTNMPSINMNGIFDQKDTIATVEEVEPKVSCLEAINNNDLTSSATKAKELEQKILGEPFAYWKKTPQGMLIQAEVGYKRREFPLPIERDDNARLRKLMEMEKRTKKDQVKKFRVLCESLDTLERFNPLEEVLLRRKLEEEARKKEEFNAQNKWQKLGMLRHWARAVQVREARELQDLDPNSEEALRKCKYLRLKKKPESKLSPSEEKEQAKKKWIANLHNRLANIGKKENSCGEKDTKKIDIDKAVATASKKFQVKQKNILVT